MNRVGYFLIILFFSTAIIDRTWATVDVESNINPPTAEVVDTTGLTSPRETMKTFLQAMKDIKLGRSKRIKQATKTLDLSEISPLIIEEKGHDLAWILSEVLNRTKKINTRKIPSRKIGKPYVFHRYESGSVTILLKADGRWLFSAETVKALPDILDELADAKDAKPGDQDLNYLPWHLRFRGNLPDQLKREWILEVWQWIGVLLVVAFGVFADKLTSLILKLVVRRWRSRAQLEAWLVTDDWLRPLGLLVMAGIWWFGLNLLGLPAEALVILLVAVKMLAGASGVWGACRVVDLFGAYLQGHARKTDTKVDDVLVPLIRKTLKVFVAIIGLLFVASNLNLNISSLIAGLGLGGLAFALAAKDLVQNLFGSITVLLDQSFHVGDWILIDDIEGTVEEVGLRSTRIRTFYNSVITMPNSRLITASVDNMGIRQYRRLKCKISLTYDTPPDQIEAFCEAVRELVRLHPYMRKDYYLVYLNEMAAASLEVLVYVFWKTPDWDTELRERHRFLLDILRVAKRLGVEFAFPTQTVYWKPAETGSESEANVPVIFDQIKVYEEAQKAAKDVVENTTKKNVKPPSALSD